MDIRALREIMGLSQAQVAEELGVPRQEVIDCEENGETYLLLQYLSVFPINPKILSDEDADPFLPSFDQTSPGHRLKSWREEQSVPLALMASALGMTESELDAVEGGAPFPLNRRQGEEIERKTGMNRKWLMYGDGREKGISRLTPPEASPQSNTPSLTEVRPAPNRLIGQKIRDAREAAGLTREAFSKMLGLSVSRVAQMESGYIKDSRAAEILQSLSAALSPAPEESPKAAGQRLRAARKKLNLTVREAAERMSIMPTTLAHLESGYVTGKHADELIAKLLDPTAADAPAAFDAKSAGARIRDERIKAGLSQKELGTILRLPASRISHIELGTVSRQEAENILRRIHGQPLREIRNIKVKPSDQVILGANIREAREQAGLSQKALGQLLELPQTRISQIERGKVDEATGRQILQRLSAIREAVPAVSEGTDALTASGSAQGPSVPQPVLGNKIRESRLGAGLSKKALGNLLGMSPGRVTRMESGTVDEATALQVLAAILEAQARQ